MIVAPTRIMPSMLTLVASVVRQLRTTDWPRSMASGSAVSEAVGMGGSGAGVGAVLSGFTLVAAFLWQPETAPTATARKRAERSDRVRKDFG